MQLVGGSDFLPLKLGDGVVVDFEKLQESGWHSDSFAV